MPFTESFRRKRSSEIGLGLPDGQTKSPAEIREVLLSKFQTNINILNPKLQENRNMEV